VRALACLAERFLLDGDHFHDLAWSSGCWSFDNWSVRTRQLCFRFSIGILGV
jgi:hypothetical protein